jgi:solute carrier family 32 (vesicular inhibitory amino acid transporter)
MLEVIWGLNPLLMTPESSSQERSPLVSGLLKVFARVLVVVVVIFLAIVFPDFDSIMALMGSTLCFTICIILPIAFYLKIFGDEIPVKERILGWVLIVLSSIMAVMGTVFAILPKEKIGAS